LIKKQTTTSSGIPPVGGTSTSFRTGGNSGFA
jgi:hypothetical protein